MKDISTHSVNISDDPLQDGVEKDEVLSVRNLTKRYGKINVLYDFSYDFQTNKIYMLVGSNGAGKTTFFNILAGKTQHSFGWVSLFGTNLLSLRTRCKHNIAYCEQESKVFESNTALEQLSMAASLTNQSNPRQKALNLLRDLKMEDKANLYPDELSKSQRRLLGLALALITPASVLLLDEPTVDLDLSVRTVLWAYIRKHKEDKIVIVSTHFYNETEALADEVVFIETDKRERSGMLYKIKKNYSLGFSVIVFFNYPAGLSREQCLDQQRDIIAELKEIRGDVVIRSFSKESTTFKFDVIHDSDTAPFLTRLEELKQEGKVSNYKVKACQLEEVNIAQTRTLRDNEALVSTQVTGNMGARSISFFEQFKFHFKMRCLVFWQTKATMLLNLLLALSFFNIFYLLVKIAFYSFKSENMLAIDHYKAQIHFNGEIVKNLLGDFSQKDLNFRAIANPKDFDEKLGQKFEGKEFDFRAAYYFNPENSQYYIAVKHNAVTLGFSLETKLLSDFLQRHYKIKSPIIRERKQIFTFYDNKPKKKAGLVITFCFSFFIGIFAFSNHMFQNILSEKIVLY